MLSTTSPQYAFGCMGSRDRAARPWPWGVGCKLGDLFFCCPHLRQVILVLVQPHRPCLSPSPRGVGCGSDRVDENESPAGVVGSPSVRLSCRAHVASEP